MEFFGYTFGRTKALAPATAQLTSANSRSAWTSLYRILESFAGAWQQNVEVTLTDVLSHPIVYACMSLLAGDVAKMGGPRLVAKQDSGVWSEIDSAAFSPVLREPNHFQTTIQFYEQWMHSKLGWGNTYVLKQRDARGVVTAMYVLDPQRVTPLVAQDSSVYYELLRDDLSRLGKSSVVVPSSEIIHDRMNTFYHPLIGLPPIHACGLAAVMGLKILNNSATLFANGSRPGGILTAPGDLTIEAAERMKTLWEANYGGENYGKVAVLGNGLTYTPMAQTARDSMLVDQNDAVNKLICAAFGVPAYMVGVGPEPANANIALRYQQYHNQCVQKYMESIEKCLDKAFEFIGRKYDGLQYGTEFDSTILLRLDMATMLETIQTGIKSGVFTPNEARLMMNLGPVDGGDTPYLQIQNSSLAAIDWRESEEMAGRGPSAEVTPPKPPTESAAEGVRSFERSLMKKCAEMAEENAVPSAA